MSDHPYLLQDCGGNTLSWGPSVRLELESAQIAEYPAWMQENTSDFGNRGMQDIPRVRVAVPVGGGVKLEDRLRGKVRQKGMAITTEETYVGWYRRYVLYHGRRHPGDLGAREVEEYLTYLAATKQVSPATQN